MDEKKRYLSLYLLQQAKIKRLSQMIAENPDENRKYRDQLRAAEMLQDEIEKKIQQVDGGVLSELLYQKYICGKSLLRISEAMNYSKRHLERLHRKALKLFRM